MWELMKRPILAFLLQWWWYNICIKMRVSYDVTAGGLGLHFTRIHIYTKCKGNGNYIIVIEFVDKNQDIFL